MEVLASFGGEVFYSVKGESSGKSGEERREDMMFDYSCNSSASSDWPDEKHKFCNAPWIFNPKELSDSERAKSPTSPLDIKPFSTTSKRVAIMEDLHRQNVEVFLYI